MNYLTEIVIDKLTTDTGLNVYYELTLDSSLPKPCISYQIYNDFDDERGDTIYYNTIQYMIKLWGDDIAELEGYKKLIKKSMHDMSFSQVSYNELTMDNQICEMMVFEGLVRNIGE